MIHTKKKIYVFYENNNLINSAVSKKLQNYNKRKNYIINNKNKMKMNQENN